MSELSFSQNENPYLNFAPEVVKKNDKYQKNFNAGTYSEKVLYQCMSDMLDAARAQYSFLPALKHDSKIDSTAQFQANYQASKDEKTGENIAQYKTLNMRLKKYGLATQGTELLLKAKAYAGDSDYSYYDVCLALIQPLLKNLKTAEILLNSSYTCVGIGLKPDNNLRNMYGSLILGNDRIFQTYQTTPSDKNLPYTKGRAGISPYNAQVCARCSKDISMEILSSCFTVKGDDVIFSCDDYRAIRKMIGKEGDEIVLDFVQHKQYDCEHATIVDNSKPFRGTVTKSFTFAKILESNEIADKKSSKLIATVCKIPETIDPNADYDINVIVLKEGKYACRTIIKKNIECKHAEFETKINFLPDFQTEKPAGAYIPSEEEVIRSIDLPMKPKKTTYTYADFEPQMKAMKLPAYTVTKVEIIAHTSLDNAKNATYMKALEMQGKSAAAAFAKRFPSAKIESCTDDGWSDFKKDLLYSAEYYYLILEPKEQVIEKLTKNKNQVARELDTFLTKHHYMRAVIHFSLNVNTPENALNVALYKFNESVRRKKQFPLAIAIQKYLMDHVEKQKYETQILAGMQVPDLASRQTFLLNECYLKYLVQPKMTESIAADMKKIYDYNPANPAAQYNMNVISLYQTTIMAENEIAKLQAAVDKLYSINTLPKKKIDLLNLEWQLKFINYLTTHPSSTQPQLLTNIYAKIKTLTGDKLSSWQTAYKLASYYIKNYDYMFALDLMTPFLSDESISEDFLFSYVSLAAHRPETYLGALFTKSVNMAIAKNPTRLCALFDKLPVTIFDNAEVKKMVCKNCNK
jgi:hypothetical protein